MKKEQENIYVPLSNDELLIIEHIKKIVNLYRDHFYRQKPTQNFFKSHLSKEEISYIYNRTNFLDNSIILRQRLSFIYSDLKFNPICEICGSPINLKKIYQPPFMLIKPWCSISCAQKHDSVKRKIIETTCNNTNESKENVINIFQLESTKQESINSLRKKFNDNRIINIGQISCRKRGYENYLNNFYVIPMFSYEEYNNACFQIDRYHNKELCWKCKHCGLEFQTNVKTKTVLPDGIHRTNICCPICFPPAGTSIPEKQIVSYIKTIFDGTIIENDRKVLKPTEKNQWKHNHEIDIWLPEINYAIEFNGTYHHGDPRFFTENDLIKGTLAKNVWELDKRKIDTFISSKIEYSIIWQYDWEANNEQEKEKIKSNIEAYKVKYCWKKSVDSVSQV